MGVQTLQHRTPTPRISRMLDSAGVPRAQSGARAISAFKLPSGVKRKFYWTDIRGYKMDGLKYGDGVRLQ